MATEPSQRLGQGQGLRRLVARGTAINAAFDIALNGLGFLKGFIVAGLITASEFGVWGLLVITLGTLLWLARIGLDDKYIQQEDADQEKAFQLAFTLQTMLCMSFLGLVFILLPLFALAYGTWEILAPGYVLALGLPATALQTPLWAYYRRMEYGKQRRLQMFDPITSFVITIILAAAGMGFWSLVIGSVAGSWASGLIAARATPYPLHFHYERGVIRDYADFSWPLIVGSASGVMVAQIPVLIAQRQLGAAAVGAVTLAASMGIYAQKVDDIVTTSIYPAVCRVRDRIDLLQESFTKSNRLALLWSLPLGAAVALFAADLVDYVIGDQWTFAITVIQLFAISAAVNQVFFNWGAFLRAIGTTRPVATAGMVMLVAVLALAVPGIYIWGLDGYAAGMLGATVIGLVTRFIYMRRLFSGEVILLNVGRAFLPTLAAVAVVLAARAAIPGADTALRAALELLAFGAVAAVATGMAERDLMKEFAGYLRPSEPRPTAATALD